MAKITVKYWRDIPSMVVVGRGRGAAKAMLPERFEQAIDHCAMKIGTKDQDAYIAQWRNVDHGMAENHPCVADGAQAVAEDVATKLDTAFNRERLLQLIRNDGWENSNHQEEISDTPSR